MNGNDWRVSEGTNLVTMGKPCKECHELLNEWSCAARIHAQRVTDLAKEIGTLNREACVRLRSEVEAAKMLSSETHLSYRLHRARCAVVLRRQRE